MELYHKRTCGDIQKGVDSIGTALNELKLHRYIICNRLRDDKGKITDTEYVIFEKPQMPDTTLSGTEQSYMENPYTDKPNTADPSTENTAKLNTNISITN